MIGRLARCARAAVGSCAEGSAGSQTEGGSRIIQRHACVGLKAKYLPQIVGPRLK